MVQAEDNRGCGRGFRNKPIGWFRRALKNAVYAPFYILIKFLKWGTILI